VSSSVVLVSLVCSSQFHVISAWPSLPTRRSSDLDRIVALAAVDAVVAAAALDGVVAGACLDDEVHRHRRVDLDAVAAVAGAHGQDRKSTRLNSSHVKISYAVFCLQKKSRTRVEPH